MMGRFKIDLKKFGLHYDSWSNFCVSQWFSPTCDSNNLLYIAYRSVVFLYLLICTVWDLEHNYAREKILAYYFIYLTNWANMCLLFTSFLQAVNSITFAAANSTFAPKLLWILLNLSHTTIMFVCVFFWMFVYDEGTIQFNFLNTHALVGVYVIIDLLVQGAPRYLHHFYQPLLFGIAYGIFTVAYFYSGGIRPDGSEAIYDALDWNRPLSATVMVSTSILSVVVLHACTFVLVFVRSFLFDKKQAKDEKTEL